MDNETSNKTIDIISLLERRGFFIDRIGESYVISDNAHADDRSYLNLVLHTYGVGYMEANTLHIVNIEKKKELSEMFLSSAPIAQDQCWFMNYKWRMFAHDDYGTKVPVRCLEPNIARYCKAISACGLKTISSCDGNHRNEFSTIFVRFQYPSYTFWHQLLWKTVLEKKFPLQWSSDYVSIYCNADHRQSVYDGLNDAALYLYKRRIQFRQLKRDINSILTKSFIRIHNDDEIKDALTFQVKSILTSYCLE